MTNEIERTKEILAAVKPLAAEYYRLTKKPLGVTGEVAEYVAADLLGLELVPPRTPGHDALRRINGRRERVQIKGRALGEGGHARHRIGSIKQGAACDKIMLVILDNRTLDAVGIWEASYRKVAAKLAEPGSRARNERGSLSISAFKQIAKHIWPQTGSHRPTSMSRRVGLPARGQV